MLNKQTLERMEGLTSIRKEIRFLLKDGFEDYEVQQLCNYILKQEVQ